jgi:hypothetical protein
MFDNVIRFGSSTNDGNAHDIIRFVYDQYTSTLIVMVKYRACSLSLAKSNGCIPCPELFSDEDNMLKLSPIFPFEGNMKMVRQFIGNKKARSSDLYTTAIFIDLDIDAIQQRRNET